MSEARPPLCPNTLTESTPDVPSPIPADAIVDLPLVDRARYAIHSELGRGGGGRIWRAHDRKLGRTLALKEPLADRARFVREALITGRLQHPAIVPIYEVGFWGPDEPFYAMKLVEGRSLREALDGASDPAERIKLLVNVIAVADAIAYAHSRGVIHRDLKPGNVIIGAFGETVVLDWGLAKDMKGSGSAAPLTVYEVVAHDLTQDGAVIGTPAYMPPEQAQGVDVDERADVYALGAVLYHLIAGSPPYEGTSSKEVLDKVCAGPPRPLARRSAPKDLAAIVRKAMAREPDARYPSASEFVDDLRRFQAGQLVHAHRYSLGELLSRWVRARLRLVLLVALGLLLVATIAAAAALRVARERDEAQRQRASAEARSDELTLVHARSMLEKDPTATLAWLKTYRSSAANWPGARALTMSAESYGVAQHVLRHAGSVTAVAFSPDGRTFATASDDHTARLWDARSGALLATTQLSAAPTGIAFSPDGETFAAIDARGELYLRHDDGSVDAVHVTSEPLFTLDFSPDGRRIATGAQDGSLQLVSVAEASVLLEVRDSIARTTRVAFSPDGARVAASGVDGLIRIWDPQAGWPLRLIGHAGAVNTVAWSPDGQLLASAGDDGQLRLWTPEGRFERALRWPQPLLSLAFSPDGQQIAAAGRDRTVRVLYVHTGGVVELRGQGDAVNEVAFSPSGDEVASAGTDGAISLWRLSTGRSRRFRGHDSGPAHVAFAPKGSALGTGGAEGAARIWPLADPARGVRELPGLAGAPSHVAYAPDGSSVVIATKDGTLDFRSTKADARWLLRAHQGSFSALAFSPSGEALVTAGWDQSVRLWDVNSGDDRLLSSNHGAAWAVAIAPGGARIAAAGRDAVVREWDASGEPRRELFGHVGDVNSLVYLRDGRLVSGGADGALRLWSAEGHASRVIAETAGEIELIALAPEGPRLAAAGTNGVWLYSTDSWTARPLSDAGHVRSLVFSPDGGTLAVASADEAILLWDVASGAARRWPMNEGGACGLAFSPDGARLASAGRDGAVRLWDVASGLDRIAHRFTTTAVGVAFSSDGASVAAASLDHNACVVPAAGALLGVEPAAIQRELEALTTATLRGGVLDTASP